MTVKKLVAFITEYSSSQNIVRQYFQTDSLNVEQTPSIISTAFVWNIMQLLIYTAGNKEGKTGFQNQILKLNVCRFTADNKQAKNINDLCYNLLNYNTAGNTEGRTHKQTFQ